MASRRDEIVRRWGEVLGIAPARMSLPIEISTRNGAVRDDVSVRPPAEARRIVTWERLHAFGLPVALKAWLRLSDGLYGAGGPLIHPLSAIGPMIPFARVPGLVVQPESWFELGNPGPETICIDLAYTRPGPDGGAPIFASGDDLRGTVPRIIAPSFESWLLRVLAENGHPYWLDPNHSPLGDPWIEHRLHTPTPPLPEYLRPFASAALPLMHPGADDRSVARRLGLSRGDVELLFRHLQHAPPG